MLESGLRRIENRIMERWQPNLLGIIVYLGQPEYPQAYPDQRQIRRSHKK